DQDSAQTESTPLSPYHRPTPTLEAITKEIEPDIQASFYKHMDAMRELCQEKSQQASDDIHALNHCTQLSKRQNDEILHIFMSGAPSHLLKTLEGLANETETPETPSSNLDETQTQEPPSSDAGKDKAHANAQDSIIPSLTLITAVLLTGY